MARLFGTNGVRGIVGDDMTAGLALRLGKAVGTWLDRGDTIALGTDARPSGDMLSAAFAAGVQSTGVNVVLLGILPTPSLQIYVRDKQFAAGAVITASHNPPEFNGIKLIAPDGTELGRDDERTLEELLGNKEWRRVDWRHVGTSTNDDRAVDHHLAAILQQVDQQAIRNARLTVVLDAGGGAGCVSAPMLLDCLGVDLVQRSCDLDGAFSDRPSEPTPASAAATKAAVKESHAHLGVMLDGDADRAAFIDEHGGFVLGDTTLALAARQELRNHPDGSLVCTSVASGRCVQDAVDEAGGQLSTTIVGSPVLAREMMRQKAVFGGEDNGGLLFARHQFCRDGVMAMAFMLELIATTGKPFSELVSAMPRYALEKRSIPVPESEKEVLLDRFKQAVRKQEAVKEVDDRDGIKAYFEEGWVLVRPSGTEPIFRVQGEASDAKTAVALVDRFERLLEQTREPLSTRMVTA